MAQISKPFAYFLRPAEIIRGYSPSNLRPDLFAGLTVTMIVLPQAIAYALIADLPPQFGLYAAIVASLVGAIWGSSNQLQKGPTNTSSLLTLSALAFVALPGTPEYLVAVAMLTLLVGLIQIAVGVARLGVLVRFVSDSVVVGFMAGAGALIFFNQVRNLLRLQAPSSADLFETVRGVWLHLPEVHLASVALGTGTVALIVLLRRLRPKLPASLLAMVAASVIGAGLGLDVRVVGELPRSLPPFTGLPAFNLDLIGRLSTASLSTAAIGVVEALSISRVMAARTGQRLDSNQEIVGLGLANVACALFSGYPSSGSFTRSAVNLQAGARTPMSTVFTAGFVLVSTLALGSFAAYIPLAALAGVLMLTACDLIDLREMDCVWRSSTGDRGIMLVTLAATLLLPLHFAVLAGILMSLAAYILHTSMPRVRFLLPNDTFTHFDAERGRPSCPQLGVCEVVGDLYFGAVQHVEERILENLERNPSQRFLLLRMHSVDNCDISAIHMLESVLRVYRERGGSLYLARVRRPVLDVMRAAGFLDALGEDHILDGDTTVPHLFYQVLDPAVCIYECPVRVFKECQNLPKQLAPLGPEYQADHPGEEVRYTEPRAVWSALQNKRPPVVIDVREPREFKRGHVPHALSLPLPAVLGNLGRVPREGAVILVCRSGRRSARAAALLRHNGYDNTQVMRGGMLAWEAANLLEAVEPYERELANQSGA